MTDMFLYHARCKVTEGVIPFSQLGAFCLSNILLRPNLMHLSEQLTVVIVTLERQDKLPTMIRYLTEEIKVKVIICDGSVTSACKSISGAPDVTYLHLPGKSVMARLADGAAKCTTPFCLLSADDDFPLLDGITSCVDSLRANTFASVATGTFYQYRVHAEDHVEVKLIYLLNYLRNIRPRGAPNCTVGRMEYLARNFIQLIWAVHRTEYILRFSTACVKSKAEETYLFEGSLSCGMALQGEYIAVPKAFCIRDAMPRNPNPLARPQRHVFSDVPEIKETYRATLNALADCADLSLEKINTLSSYPIEFTTIQDWMDAQFRDRSLLHPEPPPQIKPLKTSDHSLDDLSLTVTLDDGLPLGDVDTTVQTFLPFLRHIREQITEENSFALRFGTKSKRRGRKKFRSLRLWK